MKANIKTVLDSLVSELEDIVRIIYTKAGIPANSDLIRSVDVKNKNNALEVYANDYVKYIESGRSKFSRKIPISALIVFIKKARLKPQKNMTINQLAFTIQNSIYQKGIRGKKGLNKKVEVVTEKIMVEGLKEFFQVSVNSKGEIIVGNEK